MTNETNQTLTIPGPELSKPVLRSGPPRAIDIARKGIEDLFNGEPDVDPALIANAIDAFEQAVRDDSDGHSDTAQSDHRLTLGEGLASSLLMSMRPEVRLEIISQWCPGCGGDKSCKCWNDE